MDRADWTNNRGLGMTRLIENLRIGTKLGIAAGLGVLFIVLGIGNQLMSNSAVRERQAGAFARGETARAAIEAKSAARGLQVGALNIRFATSDEEGRRSRTYALLFARVDQFDVLLEQRIHQRASDTPRAEARSDR